MHQGREKVKTKIRVKRRLIPQSSLKVDTYRVIIKAVEEGIEYGWNRAHKHTDSPTPALVKETIENAVMNSLSEVFIWPER